MKNLQSFLACYIFFIHLIACEVSADDFLLGKQRFSLDVTNQFIPESLDQPFAQGFFTTYDRLSILDSTFLIGGYRTSLNEKAETGLWHYKDGAMNRLISGNKGFFAESGNKVFVIMNEFGVHDSFGSVYSLEVYDLVHIRKMFVLNGYIASFLPHKAGIIISGREFEKPFASAISVEGSLVSVTALTHAKEKE